MLCEEIKARCQHLFCSFNKYLHEIPEQEMQQPRLLAKLETIEYPNITASECQLPVATSLDASCKPKIYQNVSVQHWTKMTLGKISEEGKMQPFPLDSRNDSSFTDRSGHGLFCMVYALT